MEWTNNCLAQQPKLSCQEFSSCRGQARAKPMFPIFPSLAANTITAKSPIIFVQDGVSNEVPDWVSDGVLDWVSEAKTSCDFALWHTKHELVSWDHKTYWFKLKIIAKHELCIHGVDHSILTQKFFKNFFKTWKCIYTFDKKDLINIIKLVISRAQQ